MKVRCIKAFKVKGINRNVNDEWNVTKEEWELLTNQNLCVIVPDEIKKENKKKPTKKVEKK
jgi:hypothetical protein